MSRSRRCSSRCLPRSGSPSLFSALPGRIAIARNHPEADAVNLMGWVGFVAVVPWIQALIWAFKPTDVIDIRNLPDDERRETAAMISRLKGKPIPSEPAPKAPTDEDKTP